MTTGSSTRSGNVLHFKSVLGQVNVGTIVAGANIPNTSYVIGVSSGDVTISNNVTGTVPAGAIITFSNGNDASIAAATPNDILIIPHTTYGQPIRTTDGGRTWVRTSIPGTPGYPSTTGWSASSYSKNLTADYVQAGTYYAFNTNSAANGGGVYVSVNKGANWTRTYSGSINASSNDYNYHLLAVPTKPGHLFYNNGNAIGGSSWNFMFSDDALDDRGNPNASQTWHAVADQAGHNVKFVSAFGFGKAAPGASYPTVYLAGQVNGVYGVWMATDFDPARYKATWRQIGPYPSNQLMTPNSIAGDPNIFGRVFVGSAGASFKYGQINYYPYLLNHDIDHDNDNSPAFLDKAA